MQSALKLVLLCCFNDDDDEKIRKGGRKFPNVRTHWLLRGDLAPK